MDSQRSPLLSWAYFSQGKSMEELRHSLLCTTLELEGTKLAVEEELKRRDDQLLQLKELLKKAIKERDEAQDKYQKILLEKLLLQQQQQQMTTAAAAAAAATTTAQAPLSGVSSIEDEPRRGIDSNNGFTSSDCEESIVSSPAMEMVPPMSMTHNTTRSSQAMIEVLPEKPLPEKGKLLQAVMKAGPLLQTLLLAGPLPQWRHPPPPLESFEIPPVTIPSPPTPPPLLPPILLQESLFSISGCNSIANCGRLSRKRLLSEGSDPPTEAKYQRLID